MKLPGTEADSNYPALSGMSTEEIITAINAEDAGIAGAVAREIPSITALADKVAESLSSGGRLFYIGAGTSGRLGILDASECPPTYGVEHGLVVGLIAGGDGAIRRAVEFAEDDTAQAFRDLGTHDISKKDVVIGISASGRTPYVLGGLKACREAGIITGCICCSKDSPIGEAADFPVEVSTGPEVVTGSTRMKAGTAQKMVLNMITTAAMIRLGKVQGSRMVNMQLSNEKLIDRGTRMIVEKTGLPYEKAKDLLLQHGSVKKALEVYGGK